MTDPYKILGITSNVSDDEVRTAYRELSKKYHPDLNQSSPASDMAEEKMVELNQAYDEIMDMRRGSANMSSQNSSYDSESIQFSDVRREIQAGNITVADDMLENGQLPHNAEWSFLKGSVCHARGWLNEAYNHFSNAVQQDPSNPEYHAAFNRMTNSRQGEMNGNPNPYNTSRNSGGGCNACNMCQGIICADCCCECMGGDLVSCC